MDIQGAFELISGLYKVDPQPRRRCGCYIRRPDVLDIKKDNVMVPLKHIDYDIEIVNSLVHITLVQTYQNPSEKFLELEYSFPLDPKSCIYRFVAQFGNNVIEGIVKQKQEAKQQYKKAIKEGRQAAYGQISDKSSDIINMEIGNIPPKTQVKITISILQELELSMNTFYKLHVPSTISPRYMNDYQPIVGGYLMLKPEENKSVKSGKANYTWNFKINLKTNKKVSFFDSPSHEIVLQNQSDNESLLTMSKQCIPCKDFVFYYTTEDFHIPSYVLGRTDVSSTVMLSFIPKFCTLNINDAYKAEVEHKTFDADIDASKGEFIFLLDRSGSMSGKRIQKATEALTLFLKSLPSDSYFNIVSFGTNFKFMFEVSQRYNDIILEKAIQDVKKMKADFGGTQIEEALTKILNNKVIEGYPKQIFLLTDGDVTNTKKVINLVEKNIKYARVHSIGIGSGASIALIKGCAQKGKGKHTFILDSENPSEKIIEILGQALSPVISKVDLKYDKSLVKSIVPNPSSVPYILKDELVNFYITFNGQIQKEAHFTFQYTDSQNRLPYKAEIIVNPQSQSQPFVDKMAHYKVIKNLEKAQKKQIEVEDHMLYVKSVDYKKSAIEESIKYQVLSQYTAFICVGKQLIDGQYQEYANKGIEKIQIQQPIAQENQQQSQSPICAQIKMCSSLLNQKNCDFRTLIRLNECRNTGLLQQSFQCDDDDELDQIKFDIEQQYNLAKIKKSNLAQHSFKMAAKKPQSSGFFGSIKGVFNNLFGPVSQKQSLHKREKLEKKDISPRLESPLKMAYTDQSIGMKIVERQIKKETNQKDKSLQQKKGKNSLVTIKDLISAQKSNGSWEDENIFHKLFPVLNEEMENLIKQFSKIIVMTYLIATWIQMNHPDKQYALLIKKAFSWCKKASEEKGIDSQKLNVLDKVV